jgi:hypothetical protein
MSSDSSDRDSKSFRDFTEKAQDKANVMQLIEELVSHMNSTRGVFKTMIISSFVLAPLCLMLTAVFILHPFFLHRILFRFPNLGIFLIFFIAVSVILASIWLYMGLSERSFFSNWNNKYNRYKLLKSRLDNEFRQK